ncbi:3-keto-disaccharide hydrolase [Dyadobacter psychrotolerans]|uniref:DUF1080 domain-containing protein n=1 Tax=Dyadobacter psychrotolerans TaxID=2541721 RepID=A0A4R5DUJ9_9BACT|nr:DUF1080 domain-containing protein [Dyadobacter psychrotolerans]TDE14633.1 DUF1080 domain-containing protein [Dyadobacter psychrotolerans]
MKSIKAGVITLSVLCLLCFKLLGQTPPVKQFELSKKEKKQGYKILFDGTSMDHWKGNTKEYVLEDGTITMRPLQSASGNLYSKNTYSDFILRFEFLLSPAGNNGLGLRHDYVEPKQGYSGMELQILDNEHASYKDLEPGQYHGSVYKIIPAKRGFLKPAGEWNMQEVRAKGDHIQVILNGETILDGNLNQATSKLKPGSFQQAVLNKSGHIAFLGHGSVVRFKNIRIKE